MRSIRMARTLLAALLVTTISTQAHAGWRCAKRPQLVVAVDGARVTEDGHYRRGDGETARTGYISPAAIERLEAMAVKAADKPLRILRCLDALIENEKSHAAKRACAVSAG